MIQQQQEKEQQVYNILQEVIDPELGINITDLGLVYEITCDEHQNININMTLTSPGCPMGDVIIEQVKEKLNNNFPDSKNQVNLVWDPPWNQDMISRKGREELNL